MRIGPSIAVGLVAAVALGAWWATAPSRRREVLFEAPIALRPGESIRGSFRPEHDGPYEVRIRFERDRPLEELGALVGGGWAGRSEAPAGFHLSFAVRGNDHVRKEGRTGGTFVGSFSREWATVQIAWIDDGRPEALDIDVRVDRAASGLATCDARLVVAAAGDWVSYAGLETGLRLATLAVVATALLTWFLVARLRASGRRRRGVPPAPESVFERPCAAGLAGPGGAAGRRLGLRAPRPAQRLAEQELDLRVDAAELVGGPLLDRPEDLRVEAQQEGLPLGQRPLPRRQV
jgi:hypothetical protein